MAYGEFAIGSWKWQRRHGSVLIAYKSSAEFDKKKADGKNDARTTFKGRKVGEVSITITWKIDKAAAGAKGPIDSYVRDLLADISPRGPNAGKSWTWTEDDQTIHNANDITIDDIDTKRPPGTGSGTATIKASTWTKPPPTPSVVKTPTKPEPWSPGQGPPLTVLVPDPPGFLNDATKPKVTP